MFQEGHLREREGTERGKNGIFGITIRHPSGEKQLSPRLKEKAVYP